MHPFNELIQLRLTVHEDLLVCDDLGTLTAKMKSHGVFWFQLVTVEALGVP